MKASGTRRPSTNRKLILCEAPFDALTFWVNGFHNVTFIYGTEGFPDDLFDAILERRVKRVRWPTTPTTPATGRRPGTPSA